MRALEIASRELEANDRQRPLLTRAAGIALARFGEKRGAIRELTHSLQTARDRGAEYDVAATIDVLDTLEDADDRTDLPNGTRSSLGSGSSVCRRRFSRSQERCEGRRAAALPEQAVYPCIAGSAGAPVTSIPGTSTVTSKPEVSSE